VITALPVAVGAVHEYAAEVPDTVAVAAVGAARVVIENGVDAVPGPAVPVASTVKEYDVPACRPVTAQVVVAVWHTSVLPRDTV
jgi:hypothetical protein